MSAMLPMLLMLMLYIEPKYTPLMPYDTPSIHVPAHLPPPLVPLVLLPTHRRRSSRTLLFSSLRRTQRSLLSQVQPHDILYAAPIMLHSPHVRQTRTSRPLRCALHNFYTLDQRTVDLVPHLDTHAGQLATQKDGGIDAAPPYVDAYAGKWVASTLSHEQDVADTGAFRIVFGEEAGTSTCRVEDGGLRGGYGCDGVRACFLDVGGRMCEDGETKVATCR